MLTIQNMDRTSAMMTSYLKESFEYVTRACNYRIKAGFQVLGIRYLHYFEQDHTLLISNITNGRVHLINILTGKLRSFFNHTATVRKIRIFNGDIYTSSWDGSVRATNYHTLEEKLRLTDRNMGRCPFFNISPDGKYLYSFTYDSDVIPMGVANSVRKWCLKSGTMESLVSASAEQKSYRKSGSVIFYRNRLYVGCDSGYLRIFDQRSGRLIKEILSEADFRSMTALFHFNYLLASDWNGYIHFLNIKTNKIDYVLKAHNTDILSMRVDPRNRNILFTSSSDGIIRVWGLPGFDLQKTILTGHTDLWSMVFINDCLLIGNIDGEIRVYDIHDLNDINFKGRIVISDQSFVTQSKNSKMFFTNDISVMEAYREKEEKSFSPQESEILLDQGNNLKVMQELFGLNDGLNKLSGAKTNFTKFFPE